MPLLLPLLGLLLLLALLPLLIPISLVQRYRVGTSRSLARGWLATTNLAAFAIASGFLMLAAAVASAWVPLAFVATLAGLGGGLLLGVVGLAVTRWEPGPGALHYTPNRWLVGSLMLLVSARLLYGIWRAWSVWGATGDDTSWLAASGAAGSMAAGAVIIGYYLAFWGGVRRRWNRHRRRASARSG